MSTNPTSISGSKRGIASTLTNYVIETETITDSDIAEAVPDQNGAIAEEVSYDKRTDLRLTVRAASGTTSAAPATAGQTLTYPSGNGGAKYHVDTVESAGTYNGLHRWNITAHRYTNWPT